jgi:hypothetical protein
MEVKQLAQVLELRRPALVRIRDNGAIPIPIAKDQIVRKLLAVVELLRVIVLPLLIHIVVWQQH